MAPQTVAETRHFQPVLPLFKEANPMPIKHCLWRRGLIRSAECRLPLTRISGALAAELERLEAGAADRAAE